MVFKTKYLGEYHDLYVQSITLLLADIFNNSWKLDPTLILSAPGLAWQVALKKINVKRDLLTLTGMVLTAETFSEVEYVMLFINMWKLIRNERIW